MSPKAEDRTQLPEFGALPPRHCECVTVAVLRRRARQEQIGQAEALTQGQRNAVRAAFKAGVPPRRIGRQFGLPQAQVRKALSILER